MNDIKTWQQGKFIDKPGYEHWSQDQKDSTKSSEQLKVRPAPEGNAICFCNTPSDAKWIASRLNLASELEQLTYDFVTGKKFGTELCEFVKKKIQLD